MLKADYGVDDPRVPAVLALAGLGALVVRSPDEVDELYARALEAGGRAHKEPFDAVWGQRYAQLRDPDGNPVDLYASLEGTS